MINLKRFFRIIPIIRPLLILGFAIEVSGTDVKHGFSKKKNLNSLKQVFWNVLRYLWYKTG